MSAANVFFQEQLCPQSLSIQYLLDSQAERNPDAIALRAPGRRPLSYAGLARQVRDVVANLNSAGIGRKDRVALVLPNGPEMALAFLAVAAGATAAPLNPAYRASEFDFYLSDLNARALMVESTTDSPAIAVGQRLGIPIIKISPAPADEAGTFTIPGINPAPASIPTFAHPDDIALVLHTSGTTSRPKIVPLTHHNICASALNISRAFNLTTGDRCINVMPLFHIHGLIGALLASLTAGASVVCTKGLDLADFFHWMHEFKPTWYTATPAMHQAVLACADSNRKIIATSPLRFIRSCSAPLPPQVMLELEKVFDAPVIESYGMTEASHQIASNPLPPLERKAGSVGLPVGAEVAILSETGKTVRDGELGEIAICGANVMHGYENNSKENQKSFSSGWFRTGDQGYLDSDGYLFIAGRLKEIINRGGEKIAPREVDEVLLSHPAVAQAATFAMPHKTLGEDVAAAIVLRDNATVTELEIREFAALQLADFKVPRRVVIVDEIPKGPTGKVQRVGLAKQLGFTEIGQFSRPASANNGAPRTKVELALAAMLGQLLNLDRIGIHDNFFELGGHSLMAAQLLAQIATKFGKSLSPSALFRAPTVEQLANLLSEKDSPAPASSLVPLQTKGSKPPLFWNYWDVGHLFLPKHLGPDQPLYGFEHVNADGISPTYERVEHIAQHYLKDVRAVQPKGPYFLGGYCFGGLIALEMAQQLRRLGEEVALLVLLTPVSITDYKSLTFATAKSFQLKQKWQTLRGEIQRHLRTLAQLCPEEGLNYVWARMCGSAYGGILSLKCFAKKIAMKAACRIYLAMRRPLPIFLHETYLLELYQRARQAYVPKAYAGRITIFKAERDSREVSGWKTIAAEGVEIHEVPGDHDSVLNTPCGSAWAELLKNSLTKAQAATSAKLTRDKQYADPVTASLQASDGHLNSLDYSRG